MTISRLFQPCKATKHNFQCSIWTQRKYANSKFAVHIRNSHSLSAATQLPSSVEGPWSSRKSLVAVQLSLQGWKIALKVGIDKQKHTLRHTLNTITKSKQLHTAHLILSEWVVFRDVNAKMKPPNVFCNLCRTQSEMPGTSCDMPDISFHVCLQILQGFGGTKSPGSPTLCCPRAWWPQSCIFSSLAGVPQHQMHTPRWIPKSTDSEVGERSLNHTEDSQLGQHYFYIFYEWHSGCFRQISGIRKTKLRELYRSKLQILHGVLGRTTDPCWIPSLVRLEAQVWNPAMSGPPRNVRIRMIPQLLQRQMWTAVWNPQHAHLWIWDELNMYLYI